MKEKSYEELRIERAQEWRQAQARAAAEIADLNARLAKMPDVRDAPKHGDLYAEKGLVCPCGSEGFTVKRWVTVNGFRHRGEFECLGCKRVDTWDWGMARWLR